LSNSVEVQLNESLPPSDHAILAAGLARLRRLLEDRINAVQGQLWEPERTPPTSALGSLCRRFGLAPFERDVLLLCAGMEMDSSWGSLCAEAAGDRQLAYPSFHLALTLLENPNWGAIAPQAPLRRWRLIELGTGNSLTSSQLRLDERILHYLLGTQHLDERLLAASVSVPQSGPLVPSHQEIAQSLSELWQLSRKQGKTAAVVQLCGREMSGQRAIASAACDALGWNLYSISAAMLPTDLGQLSLLAGLCEREYYLSNTTWALDCTETDDSRPERESAIARFIETCETPLVLLARDRRRQRQRPLITFEIRPPTSSEQRLLWQNGLTATASDCNGQIETLVSCFNLSSAAIQATCAQFQSQQLAGAKESTSGRDRLWDLCRVQARPRLDELAQRLEASATWEDLVLPARERDVLQEIASHVRQRLQVYEQWGFAGKSKRGLGISALFAGASGTGKTMAAELVAAELRLDIYRIDLSSVVSKYIGETEKNLCRLFDAAESGGVILLFDEADALFGKRSEVKDSHDRHANIEVSYLLQRMEAYRGLAILTTNLKSALDQAFLRRIRFVVNFPFPDVRQRVEIWQRIFPPQTPTKGLDWKKLAKLNVAGGNIRNIALNAAFIAADAGESVQMKHVLQSARSEYLKIEQILTDAEIKHWV